MNATWSRGTPSHHDIGPDVVTWEPPRHPEPVGPVTALDLRTPAGEMICTVIYNETGLDWEHRAVSLDAQARTLEVQEFLRDFHDGDPVEVAGMVRDMMYPDDHVETPWPSLAEWRRLLPHIKAAEHDVFAAFRLCPLERVRVVIVGQDPYPDPDLRTGLAFSVPRDVKRLPVALRNIHKAMEAEGLTPPEHGDLTAWAEQGVLLLNMALTLEPGNLRLWRPFTNEVLRRLRDRPVAYVLWGKKAQRLGTPPEWTVTAFHPTARKEQAQFRSAGTFGRVDALVSGIKWGGGLVNWAPGAFGGLFVALATWWVIWSTRQEIASRARDDQQRLSKDLDNELRKQAWEGQRANAGEYVDFADLVGDWPRRRRRRPGVY